MSKFYVFWFDTEKEEMCTDELDSESMVKAWLKTNVFSEHDKVDEDIGFKPKLEEVYIIEGDRVMPTPKEYKVVTEFEL